MFSSVAVITSNNEAVVEQCDKTMGQRFSDAIQKLISDLGSSPASTPAVAAVPASQPSHLDQLEKLFDLKQKGILTEEEFAAQKAKLLGL